MKRNATQKVKKAWIEDLNDNMNSSILMILYEGDSKVVPYEYYFGRESRVEPKNVIGLTSTELFSYCANRKLYA